MAGKAAWPRAVIAVVALGVLAGCGSRGGDRAPVEVRGTDPGIPGVSGPAPRPASRELRPGGEPDADGIVLYDGYAAVVARSGDTVQSVADRIGLSATELGAYNGLTPGHRLTAGDELVLPPRPGGYGDTVLAGADPVTPGYPVTPDPVETGLPGSGGPIESAPLGGGAGPGPAAPAPAPGETGWSPTRIAEAIERGAGSGGAGAEAETFPQSPSDGEAVPGLATPIPDPTPQTRPGPAPEPAGTEVAALPPEPAPAPAPAPSAGTPRLMRPVEGPVALGYNQGAGPAKNDGVDFAAPAGAPVVAAGDGTVALVSQSLGGLGTIVLIRHSGGLLTVYGRITDVDVIKGDTVRRGQRIGVVADAASPAEPRMHFEVRRGAESVDPMDYL